LQQTTRILLNHACENQETLVRAAMQFTSHQVIPNQWGGRWPETTRRGQQLRDRYSSVPHYKGESNPSKRSEKQLPSSALITCFAQHCWTLKDSKGLADELISQ